MSNQTNSRETGARHLPAKTDADANDDVSQDAAANRKPGEMGNAEPIDDHNEKTRHYDGKNPGKQRPPSPATEKVSGAGTAMSQHSKDARAPQGGRPGAHVKDDTSG